PPHPGVVDDVSNLDYFSWRRHMNPQETTVERTTTEDTANTKDATWNRPEGEPQSSRSCRSAGATDEPVAHEVTKARSILKRCRDFASCSSSLQSRPASAAHRHSAAS